MNLPSRHWHYLYLGLLLVLQTGAAHVLHANTVYTSESANLPQARYTSSSTVHMIGERPYTSATQRVDKPTPRIELKFAPFSEVEGVTLMLTDARLVATNVIFRNCHFILEDSARVDLNGCVLQGTRIALGGGTYAGGNPLPPSHFSIERNLSWVTLDDSILSDVQLTYYRRVYGITGGGTNLEGTFQFEHCSIYGPSFALPAVPVPVERLVEYVKKNELQVKACKFTDCMLGAGMLAVTDDCVFENCRPNAEPPPILGVDIKGTFLPAATSAEITSKFPQFKFTPTSLTKVGSSLAHTVSQGIVTLTGRPAVGAIRENQLSTVLATIPAPSRVAFIRPPGGTQNSKPTPPPTEPAAEPAFVGNTTGTEGAPDSGLKLKQTSVNGLLIMSLGSGEAGSASKMSAIALASSDSSANSTVRFNQPVGEMMGTALGEVSKFTQLNCGGWPKGHAIEISFADKYSNKDGPSAAVACALLLHSLITGQELDPAFAVTGDMNADGSVQPIGGVAAKIRGATKGHCKLIGIPSKNESSLGDLLLTDGPAPFASIQVFSIEKFSDAETLALTVKPENTTTSIAEMNQVQEVLMRNPAQIGAWLKNQHVIAKLQQVLKNSPNNLSAKYLLLYASGRVPQVLSLAGSLNAIDNTAGDLIAAIKANKGDSFDGIGKSSVGSSLTRLQALRIRCDPRTRPYADAIITFGAAVKEALDRPAQTGPRALEYRNKIRGAASSVESALSRLLNDPAVREELEG